MALPVTVPFGLLSLVLFRTPMDIYAMFGLFMLVGIVKKNGILQVDATNQLRARGMPRHEAIIEANHTRLRPILMTTVMLVAAMVPIALGQGPGAGARASMAKVIIGGQMLSLVLALLVTPVFYALLDSLTGFLRRKGLRFSARPSTPKHEPHLRRRRRSRWSRMHDWPSSPCGLGTLRQEASKSPIPSKVSWEIRREAEPKAMPRSRLAVLGLIGTGVALMALCGPLHDALRGGFRFPRVHLSVKDLSNSWDLPRLAGGDYNVFVETDSGTFAGERPLVTVVDGATLRAIPSAIEGDMVSTSSTRPSYRVGGFRASAGRGYRMRVDFKDRSLLLWNPEVVVRATPAAVNNEVARVFLGRTAIAGLGLSLTLLGLTARLCRPKHG